MLVSWRGPACLAETIPHPAHPIGYAEARPQGRARPGPLGSGSMINHQSTRRSRIIPRACRPLHPAKFARCSLRCAPLAASRGKISGALFPRVFLSQAGPPRRGHTRAMAAYHSGPHNLRKKTPGKTPLLPRGAAYGHRLRAGGRAVGAHRPTQPGSAGNRTSAQACAARSALPAPPP